MKLKMHVTGSHHTRLHESCALHSLIRNLRRIYDVM